MAKSNAKRIRERLVREGKMNPADKRSPYALTDMRTRKNKTKKDYLYQEKHKKNHQIRDGNDGSFILLQAPNV